MTDAQRAELEAFNAYWPKTTESMPHAQFRRWCELQIMARDEAQTQSSTPDNKDKPNA